MKKMAPIFLLVLLIGGGLVVGSKFLSQKPSTSTETELSKPKQEKEEEGESLIGGIRDALSLGKSMKCTWERDEANFGTAYVKNEKVYTEVTAGGKKMFSVYADDCTYTWSEGEDQGMKFCVEPGDQEEKEEGETVKQDPFSWETPDISYSCKNEIISDSRFNPPSNVQFSNPFEALEGMELPEGFEMPEGVELPQ